MVITCTEVNEILVVNAVFKGNIQFDDFSESYLFEDLVLDTFKIHSDPFADSKPIVKTIK